MYWFMSENFAEHVPVILLYYWEPTYIYMYEHEY